MRFDSIYPLAGALLALVGCPGGADPVLVAVPIEAASVLGDRFETDAGYEIALEQGLIILGDLHFHEPGTVASLRGSPPAPLRWLTGPAVARAHPGHDMSGDVRGELPGIFAVDLLGSAVPLGEGSFWAGDYATASLLLRQDGVDGEADLPAGSPVAGHTLVLAGTASDGGEEFPFDLVVDHTAIVAGIPLETSVLAEAPPALTLEVDPAAFLAHLDFAVLDGDGDGVVTMDDDDVVNPLQFGLESNLAYRYVVR
jgi:hypothetical protein